MQIIKLILSYLMWTGAEGYFDEQFYSIENQFLEMIMSTDKHLNKLNNSFIFLEVCFPKKIAKSNTEYKSQDPGFLKLL